MSFLTLKILAAVAMLADHIGLVFGWQGWNLLPFSSTILRTIGRVSFPLFAFCLARGWHTTRNRKRYFQNLMIGAAASQIPFTLAFYGSNLTATVSYGAFVHFDGLYCLFAAVAVYSYWSLVLNRRWQNSILIAGAAAILPGIRLQICGVWILSENENVFYTFLMAFLCLYILQERYRFSFARRGWLFVAVPLLLIGYGLPADYGTGLLGMVLIVGLAQLSTSRQQAVFLAMWSLLYYGFFLGNLWGLLACMVACGMILAYRPNRHSVFRAKKFFYWFYPVHLFLLGIINVGIRFIVSQ